MRLRHIPFRALGTSDAHLRYLEEDAELEPFLGRRPRGAAELLRHAPLNARRLVPRDELAQTLVDYAHRHEAPQPSLEGAERLALPDVHVVVTGQQPGLFGGPLYTIHKAATVVRLAEELNTLLDGPRVVPLFWNHTDDHDLDEVNRAFFINPNLDIQRFRLDLSRSGEFLRYLPIGHAMEPLLVALEDIFPHTDFREEAFQLFRPRDPDETFGDVLTRLLLELFGERGLVVIEPRDLPPSAFGLLERWSNQREEIREIVRAALDELGDLGVEVSVDPMATLIFQRSGSRRVPLAQGDPPPQPTDLSPGALLRPLWQDASLPTLGFVVGPGELGYLAAVGPLYRRLGVPRPALVPRASLTLVEPSIARLLERFGWDIPDLIVGPEALARTLMDESDDPIQESVEELISLVRERISSLATRVRETDPQLLGALERCRSKVTEEIHKLGVKLRRSRRNREGTGLRQIRRICANLRPRGRLQERVLNVLPFLVAHGAGLADHLVAAADPFSVSHGVLEL